MKDPRAHDRLIAAFRADATPSDDRLEAVLARVSEPTPRWKVVAPRTKTPAASSSRSRPVRGWAWIAAAAAVASLLSWWVAGARRNAAVLGQLESTLAPYADAAGPGVEATVRREAAVDRSVVAPSTAALPIAPVVAPADASESSLAPGRPEARRRSVAVAPVDPLAEETALIGRAESELRADDPAAALAVLADHARRYPAGRLGVERRALRVIALCRSGKIAQGRGEAAVLRREPASRPYADRMARACTAK